MEWIKFLFLFGCIAALYWWSKDNWALFVKYRKYNNNITKYLDARIKVLESLDEEQFRKILQVVFAELDKDSSINTTDESSPILHHIDKQTPTK